MESEELAEKLLGLIHSMATAALAVPSEDREAWFRRNRQSCYDEAIARKMSLTQAVEWADQMDLLVRSLTGIIQNSGGKSGGTA
jgi:hypothetical protein